MKKLFLLFYLLIASYSFAQKSDIGRTYHFNLALEYSTSGELAELSKIKLINTANDNIEGVSGDLNFITVHDFKRGFLHSFKKIKRNEVEEYIYEGSNKKTSSRKENYVEIKKLEENMYQLTRFNSYDKPTEILIINLEDFEQDAANSLQINDVLFLDSNYLKKLRRKEKGRNFIIRSYQTTYDGKKINYKSVVKTEKIDITLTVPKKLIYFSTKNP
jgi:hypothetical protein